VPDPVTDRRAEVRWPVDFDVDYRIEGTYLFASIIDISALGIFVCTNEPRPQGTRLHLRFTPPVELGAKAATPFELEGEVVWVSAFSSRTIPSVERQTSPWTAWHSPRMSGAACV